MSNKKIAVSEADIDDELMQQHMAAPIKKSWKLSLPKIGKPSFKKPSGKFSPLKALVLLVIVAGGVGGYYYQSNRLAALKQENERLANPQIAAEDEANRLRGEVAQLMELPNENATIATVVDAEKLKTQAFFANAQNGDRVLLFANAKKAILYRPSTKKIIDVAPISIGNTTGAPGVAGASTTTQPAPAPAPAPAPNKKP